MNIDPAAYLSRPAIVQAAKNNAYYIGRLKQHLDDFDKDLAEWKASGEWKKDYKTWGAACEIALNMSRRWANKLISNYEESKSSVSGKTGITVPAEPDTDKSHESEMRMSLPSPEELLGKSTAKEPDPPPVVVVPTTVAAPKPVPEKKPRERNDNGKPVYALSVWKDLLDFYGHALNRLSDANRVLPDEKLYATMEAGTKDLMNKARIWRERGRK